MKSATYITSIVVVLSIALLTQTGNNRQFNRQQSSRLFSGNSKTTENTISATQTPVTNTESANIYFSQQTSGIIGKANGSVADDPHDNVFHIYIGSEWQQNKQAYLEYDLYGAGDFTSVSRSINDNVATGGAFVKLINEWSGQSEKIASAQLHAGDNIVRFSVPGNGDEFSYKVKNVRVRFGESVTNTRQIVINQPLSHRFYENEGYISGFLSGPGSSTARIYADGKQVRSYKGAFEGIAYNHNKTEGPWVTELKAVFPDGEIVSRTVVFDECSQSDFSNELNREVVYNETTTTPQMPVRLNVPGFSLEGSAGSVATNIQMSVTGLRQEDMPLPGLDMINVTAENAGFRCLPHGKNFDKDVELRIKYDPARIPAGYGPKDIRMFYYDEGQADWVVMPQDSVDMTNCEIISHTNHFTDFIDGILKTPESPQTQAFTPTSMKDMKFGDPLAGVNMMSPPQANSNGTANLSYPIQLPAGRQGMQPNIAITYNSEGGNGIMGMGWNFATPAITVDTRWGVPHFLSDLESESYLINGEQLLPMIQRDTFVSRNLSGDKIFTPRVEGAFDKIIRHGNAPDEYWWEVIDKQGTHFYYGKYSSDAGVNSSCVLADAGGNIAQWTLTEVRDLNGNYIKYSYTTSTRTTSPGQGGKDIYLSDITYTGYQTTDGKYNVEFLYDTTRSDYSISGRYGFLQLSDRLLRAIRITYDNQFIRGYGITYETGAYNKSLVCGIAEFSDSTLLSGDKPFMYTCENLDTLNASIAKVHKFDYYQDTTQEFSDPAVIHTQLDESQSGLLNNLFELPESSTIGRSHSDAKNIGGSLNVGIGANCFLKTFSLGGNLNFSWAKAFDDMMLLDINGDGLPDRVYKIGNSVYYRKLELNGDQLQYSSQLQNVSGLGGIGKTSASSNSWGLEGQIGPPLLYVAGSFNHTNSSTFTQAYFSDVNSDGYIDYIDNGIVFYNRPDANGDPVFTQESSSEIQYVFGDSCSYIIRTGSVNDSVYTPDFERNHEYEYTRDGVRIWIAPFSGTVTLDNNVQLLEDTSYSRSQSMHANGVLCSVQFDGTVIHSNRIYATDYAVHQWDSTLSVVKGDRLYFRVQSMLDRSYDVVDWNPVITYSTIDTGSVDADGKKIGIFEPETDVLVSDRNIFQAPFSGKIMIKGSMTSDPLSDSLFFTVKKGQTVMESATFPDSTSINYFLNDSMQVAEGDSIIFEAYSSTNVNFNGIENDFRIYYYQADSVTIDTSSLYSRIEVRPVVQYHIFQDVIVKSTPITSLANATFIVHPYVLASSSANGELILAVKSNNDLLAKGTVTIVNGQISGTPTLTFQHVNSVPVYFEYYAEDPDFANLIGMAKVTLNTQIVKRTCGFHTMVPDSMWKFGNLYRGWGQFTYFSSDDTLQSLNPIDESKLHYSAIYYDSTTILAFDTSAFTDASSAESELLAGGMNNQSKQYFNTMYADPDSVVWRDYARQTYIGNRVESNSCLNDILSESDTIFDSPVIINSSPGVSIHAVRKYSTEVNTAWSVSVGSSFSQSSTNTLGLSYSHNSTSSKGMMDYTDLNGDRYPDVVGSKYVQYSTPQGGIFNNVTHVLDDGNFKSESDGFGVSFGINLPVYVPMYSSRASFYSTIYNDVPRRAQSQQSANLSGTYYSGNSESTFALIDVNGDGLPDRINQDNGTVSLNKGYSFNSTYENWNLGEISKNECTSLSVNAGESLTQSMSNIISKGLFSKCEYSWSGGVGMNLSLNNQNWGMSDMNNDGLIDIVHYDSGTLEVYINSGHGFGSSHEDWSDGNYTNKGLSYGASGYLGGSFGIPLLFMKIVFSVQVGATSSTSFEKIMLTDMNNDGYPDIIAADDSTSSIAVCYSQLGKVNLLKEVKTPTESKYIVDYTLSSCDQDMPSRKWNMSSLKVYDGFTGDGQDTTYQKFEYADGFYNRFERTFFGYNSVVIKQMDNLLVSGSCYRQTRELYHNHDYLFKGKKYYEAVEGDTNLLYIETYYKWNRLEISSGDIVPSGSEVCYGPYYPGVSQEDRYYYEGGANYQIHTRKTYLYGLYGNVSDYYNYNDMADSTDRVHAVITYSYDTTHHLLAMVDQMDVYDYQNNLMRRKTGDYDTLGQITVIGAYNGSNYAYIDIDYDSYGNISRIEYPEDVNNDRMSFDYEYDTYVNTYPERVTDRWGDVSVTYYDMKLGLPTKMFDMSGNAMEFSYYADGKPKTVTGPNELAANIPWTIKFEYWDEQPGLSGSMWAKTLHYDTLNAGNYFVTVNISDGLGRSIQSKQKATINGVDSMVVSGRSYYDAYGRIDSVSLPATEALGNELGFTAFSPTHFATSVFDVLDRPLVQTAPDTTTVSYDYDFGTDYFGKLCFKTKVTDPNSIITTKYNDARGLNTSVTAPLSTITRFYYDPMGELIQSDDPEGNSTEYHYDMLGRLTSRDHPDAGTTSYTYDDAGHVLTVQTENLNAYPLFIEYNYSDGRLSHISYPQNPEMDVYYEYGDSSSGNQAGRLIRQQDASGVQTFEYGDMGELIKNIHTFVLPDAGQTYTFETNWEYDSWNRMKNITYPDSEVVSYHYNNGGQLSSLDGVKESNSYSYIDSVQYNKYGSRTRIDYGNGTYALYTYYPLNQRLKNLTSYESTANILQSIEYSYDNASNITGISNNSDVVNGQLGGDYSYSYTYDNLYRLTASEGWFDSYGNGTLSFSQNLSYTASGKIDTKDVYADRLIGGSVQTINYSNTYQYNDRPHNVTHAGDYDYTWDADGNLISRQGNGSNRYLCWDEENRLTTVYDEVEELGSLSAYLYDAGGERAWKLAGDINSMYINGQGYVNGVDFGKTLYVNPYMVINDREYTKHYYIEGERVCSKIGGGFGVAPKDPDVDTLDFIVNGSGKTAENLWLMVQRGAACSGFNPDYITIEEKLGPACDDDNNAETNLYFYHPDHLGSSSFITDAIGYASQHLQYLPFGETFVDQQNGYDSRYTFSAKEKDDETQYSYFGARYYDADLSVWLSVDPMAGERFWISPYSYCQWNPVGRVDPSGALDKKPDDYFDSETGAFLGDDKDLGVTTDNVRTITKEKWDAIHNNTGKSDKQKALSLHTASEKLDYRKPISDNVLNNICKYYYQKAGYNLDELENKGFIIDDYYRTINSRGDVCVYPLGYARTGFNEAGKLFMYINRTEIGSLNGLKNRWDFISLFQHERGAHGRDFLNGLTYSRDNSGEWEYRAYYFQLVINRWTFMKTSPNFRDAMIENASEEAGIRFQY